MLILAGIYVIVNLFLITGFRKFLSAEHRGDESIKISVIIPAKNEGSNLRSCLDTINRLDYLPEAHEIIIVDDNSTDDTYKIAAEISRERKNVRVIKANEKLLPGKRSALLTGIKQSLYPFIVITDADCRPSSGWLRSYSAMLEEGYDLVFGPSPFYSVNNIINKISCIENLKNQFLYFSLTSLGFPYTASARNMGFSREAFLKIGGYTSTTDTSGGDDDLLLREAVRHKLKVKAFYDKSAFVYSNTKNTLKEYLSQKARHIQTSFHYLLRHRIILGGWHLINLFMLLSPLLIFVNINFIWLFMIKMLVDMMILLSVQKKFGYDFTLIEIFYLDILYEIFIIINFFNALFRKIEWK